MVERRFCTPEVRSSILLGSTKNKIAASLLGGNFNLWTRTESDLRHFRENRIRGRGTLSRSLRQEVL
jgi:hypothetical protein